MSSSASSRVKFSQAVTSSFKFSTRVSAFSPFSASYMAIRPLFLMTSSLRRPKENSSVSSSKFSIKSRNEPTALRARPASCFSLTIYFAACHKDSSRSRAAWRIISIVRLPMPRVGVLITRSIAASSSRLPRIRKYANASFIS